MRALKAVPAAGLEWLSREGLLLSDLTTEHSRTLEKDTELHGTHRDYFFNEKKNVKPFKSHGINCNVSFKNSIFFQQLIF